MRLRTALGAVILGILAGVTFSPSPWPPCPTEDSVGCHWDSSEPSGRNSTGITDPGSTERQGNGQGRSFVVEDDGTVVYLVSHP